MSNFNLYNVLPGDTVRISRLTASGSIRRRLLDMGLTEGAQATCLYESPSGDPRAYFIRGAVIALRSEDAAKIQVTPGGFLSAREKEFNEIAPNQCQWINSNN